MIFWETYLPRVCSHVQQTHGDYEKVMVSVLVVSRLGVYLFIYYYVLSHTYVLYQRRLCKTKITYVCYTNREWIRIRSLIYSHRTRKSLKKNCVSRDILKEKNPTINSRLNPLLNGQIPKSVAKILLKTKHFS